MPHGGLSCMILYYWCTALHNQSCCIYRALAKLLRTSLVRFSNHLVQNQPTRKTTDRESKYAERGDRTGFLMCLSFAPSLRTSMPATHMVAVRRRKEEEEGRGHDVWPGVGGKDGRVAAPATHLHSTPLRLASMCNILIACPFLFIIAPRTGTFGWACCRGRGVAAVGAAAAAARTHDNAGEKSNGGSFPPLGCPLGGRERASGLGGPLRSTVCQGKRRGGKDERGGGREGGAGRECGPGLDIGSGGG